MTLYLADEDATQLLDPHTAVEAVEQVFRHQANGTAKTNGTPKNRPRQPITMPHARLEWLNGVR
jgi:ornithine cyclodeaminase/alanine dehydrogenase-like protein (mu-crystallin family)